MILYPKYYCKKVTDIDINFLKENNIKGLILDVDNTLIDFDLNIIQGAKEWCESVERVANLLEIDYVFKAWKPLKKGLIMGKEKLNLDNENIATVGDQIFTDVIGGNRLKMFSILVEPIAKKDIWITRLKRPIENLVINCYKKSIN